MESQRPASSEQTIGAEAPPPESRLEFLVYLAEEIPVYHGDNETGRGTRLIFRVALLMVVTILVYSTCFWNGLLDGEAERLQNLVWPDVGIGNIHQIAGWFDPGHRVPNLLRILIYLQRGPEGSTPLFPVVGVALHATAVVLLWLVLRRLNQSAAFVAALLFAVHPANAPAVAWVSQQGRLWGAVFSLLGVLMLLKNRNFPPQVAPDHPDYFQAPAAWFVLLKAALTYLGAAIAFIAAVLCQPATAVVPIVIVILLGWKKKLTRPDWLALVPILVIATILLANSIYQPAAHPMLHSSHVQSHPIAMMLWPIGRLIADFLLLHSVNSPWVDANSAAIYAAVALSVLLLITLPLTIVYRKKIGAGVGVSLTLFLLLIPTVWAPVAVHVSGASLQGIINPGEGYLCNIPLIVLIASLLLKLSLRWGDELQRVIRRITVIIAITLGLGIDTGFTAGNFGSTERLLSSAVKSESNLPVARSRLAEYYLSQSTPQGLKLADLELGDVKMQDCADASTAVAKGDYLQATGHSDQAVQWYEHAQSMDDQNADAAGHLAALYVRLNRVDQAVDCYRHAIEKHPENPALKNDYGLLLGSTGHVDQAVDQFNEANQVDPEYVPAHVNLANAFISLGKFADAAAELQKTVVLDPDNFQAFHNAGVVLAQTHDYDRAIRMLTTAVQLKPDSAEARNDLGVVLTAAAKFNRAIFEFEQALARDPGYAPAQHNLEIAKRRLADQKSQQMTHSPTAPG
jgi:Tfp pilus assembly protein PilF